jgi:uncharacterized membrane protein
MASLIAAVMTMGIVAGVFQLYAYAIMPGLGRTDDRTLVGAFQQIDGAIINPYFMFSFFGALVFTALAAVLHVGADERSVLPWAVVALALYLAAFAITLAINVPLNDGIKAAGSPDRIVALRAVRERFDEVKWVRWNIIRAAASTIASAASFGRWCYTAGCSQSLDGNTAIPCPLAATPTVAASATTAAAVATAVPTATTAAAASVAAPLRRACLIDCERPAVEHLAV